MRWVVALLVLGSGAQAAERWVPDRAVCEDKSTTGEVVECMDARTRVWDGRLNQAWAALTQPMAGDPAMAGQLAALRKAQRLWVQFRDANCRYYAGGQGSIRFVSAAMCRHDMTQSRAIELQVAALE